LIGGRCFFIGLNLARLGDECPRLGFVIGNKSAAAARMGMSMRVDVTRTIMKNPN
jgi:hypothetical protein